MIGRGLSIAIVAVEVGGFWLALNINCRDDRHVALATCLAVGVVAALLAAGFAAWNRSWWVRIPPLFVGALSGWAGPDPPAEAYADTAPFGVLLGGWLPGGLFVAVAFVACLLPVTAMRKAAARQDASRMDS